ncbi:hypothetical protein DI272_16630 [Streptomyces sp. Act143]|nr:hypothetical protein DI272_16630 [Streptomyces sp. Act143]
MVRPALARIVAGGDGYAPDGDDYWGSGFFVAPGWLLTCAHVVGEGGAAVMRAGGPVGVSWQGGTTTGQVILAKPGHEALGRGRGSWKFPDIALVRVRDADDARCVWLSDRAPALHASVSLHGWSLETGDLSVRYGTGRISGVDGKALLLSGALPVGGLSGGPVLDRRSGAVIGMNKGRGENEGAAVPVTALRELFDSDGGDVLHTVIREHDLHHLRHFTDSPATAWTTAQADLHRSGAPGLDPELRVRLYGYFAELRPPTGPGPVVDLVAQVKAAVTGEDTPPLLVHDPRTWREGVGLLHGLRDRSGSRGNADVELDAVLLYAAHVARRAAGQDPRLLRAFAAWLTEQAERHAYWPVGEAIRTLLADLGGASRTAPAFAGTAAVPDAAAPSTRVDVLVRIGDVQYGDRYPWSVQLLYDGQVVTPVDGDDVGVPLGKLEESVRGPLAKALSLGDHDEHLAAVEVFLPRRLFDLPVDEWQLTPHGTGDDDSDALDEHAMPIGLRRTVVLRAQHRNTRPPSPEWRRRQKGVTRGPLTAVPLRAEAPADGHAPGVRREGALAVYGRLGGADDACVPVHCGPVGSGDGHEAMGRALLAGHSVAVWRRDAHRPDECAAFHAQAARLLELAGRADRLARQVRELRIRLSDPDTAETQGLKGRIALLLDPPDRPRHGTEPMQPPALAGPEL